MRRYGTIAVCALIVVASTDLLAQGKPGSLRGAWQVVESAGADGKPNTKPEPGLYVFTDRHYSIVRVMAPRQPLSEKPTDQEKVAAYDPFVANSGSYQLKDGKLMTRPMVAKNPSVMTGPGGESSVKFEGADMLVITSANGAVTKLKRVE